MHKTGPVPREAVQKMKPYSPPTAGRTDRLRLDFNENTVGCSPAVIRAIAETLSEGALATYPEYSEVKKDLAEFFGVLEAQMVLTNGTDEAIQIFANTYINDGDDVLALRPSYAMYQFYIEVAGGSLREIQYRDEALDFPLSDLLAAIRPSTRAILISNPNNPTGTAIDKEGILRILRHAPEAAVLIDEAYYEFCGVTALPMIDQYPNLFVSRTFSKAYGLAAMRIGCLFSNAVNVASLHKSQSPYSVNALAAIAARAAVHDVEHVRRYVSEILSARDLLCAGLQHLKISYIPSQANFVLFRVGARAIEIRDTLRERGVLVRDRSYELPGCMRVTVGTRAQVERFLKELESIR